MNNRTNTKAGSYMPGDYEELEKLIIKLRSTLAARDAEIAALKSQSAESLKLFQQFDCDWGCGCGKRHCSEWNVGLCKCHQLADCKEEIGRLTKVLGETTRDLGFRNVDCDLLQAEREEWKRSSDDWLSKNHLLAKQVTDLRSRLADANGTIEAMADPKSVGNPAWLASRMQERAERAESQLAEAREVIQDCRDRIHSDTCTGFKCNEDCRRAAAWLTEGEAK